MIQETLLEIFERDLNRLKAEITLYASENDLWIVKEGISNSAGNLCLHITGNLNHFIGAAIGQSGYIRDREKEFTVKDIPRQELLQRIDDTILVVKTSLGKLAPEDFDKIFPVAIFGKPDKVDFILIHLASHLSYHLGQINYHRRLLA